MAVVEIIVGRMRLRPADSRCEYCRVWEVAVVEIAAGKGLFVCPTSKAESQDEAEAHILCL